MQPGRKTRDTIQSLGGDLLRIEHQQIAPMLAAQLLDYSIGEYRAKVRLFEGFEGFEGFQDLVDPKLRA